MHSHRLPRSYPRTLSELNLQRADLLLLAKMLSHAHEKKGKSALSKPDQQMI